MQFICATCARWRFSDADKGADVYGGYIDGTGSASGNIVNLTDSIIAGTVYGGYANGAAVDAEGVTNTINTSGTVNVDNIAGFSAVNVNSGILTADNIQATYGTVNVGSGNQDARLVVTAGQNTLANLAINTADSKVSLASKDADTTYTVTNLTNKGTVEVTGGDVHITTLTNDKDVKINVGKLTLNTISSSAGATGNVTVGDTYNTYNPAGWDETKDPVYDSELVLLSNATITENLTVNRDGKADSDVELTVNGNLTNAGEITNSGTLDVAGSITNSGTLGNSGDISAASVANTGDITVSAGSLAVAGTLDNDGDLTVSGGSVSADTFDSSGTALMNGGSTTVTTLTNSGDMTVTGTAQPMSPTRMTSR